MADTGLDLSTFLRLLRADLGAWASLGVIVAVLALMAWTSWGSRRALRKCLVLSIAVHLAMVFYGRWPGALLGSRARGAEKAERIRQIRVTPLARRDEAGGAAAGEGRAGGRRLADWDRPGPALAVALADPVLRPSRPGSPRPAPARRDEAAPVAPESVAPAVETPEPPGPESRPVAASADVPTPRPRRVAPADPSEFAAPSAGSEEAPTTASSGPATREDAPVLAMPDLAGRLRPDARREPAGPIALAPPRRLAEGAEPPAIERATPSGSSRLPEGPPALGLRPLPDVPEVYRPRLDPNRSALAQRAGASAESEQAVERALDWLARHQDADGRWDGGTAKNADGTVGAGERSFTDHCPPGEICFGECFYWEADSAMTGLALLAYLGAGYTQIDGKYAQVVDHGLQYLLLIQKPDGDLRGQSRGVGMYCHAMASLALCEAFALTGDERLRGPATRAVEFLVKGQAADGMSWRYEPRERVGDTSILGWVILVLKSAKVVGIAVPAEARTGAIRWLGRVADGKGGGLAFYQPGYKVTPTMTAEAWVCRQFLGVGGPGPASDEAAAYLLAHGPDRDPYNLYYWYYGTLALYQHGGDAWARWNAQARDQLVRRQHKAGHRAGSWDPDEDKYGSRGGRIYSTALATLTLEVYYRYLRLYDEPDAPPNMAPAPDPPGDARIRRAGRRPDPRRR
jgi:hypothetical protein